MTMKVAMVPLKEIEIGERFRKEYGDIKALGDDISNHGLIQPLAVAEQSGAERPYMLLAGGRRLRALTERNVEIVPVRIFPAGLSELEKRSIELSENFHRKNLEYHEHVLLTEEIHRLMQEIHGPRVSTAADAPGWGLRQTAELLGVDHTSVAKDVQLAKMLRANPELFKDCKNKKEATKRVEQVATQIAVEELAKRATANQSDSAKKRLIENYIIGDVLEALSKIPDKTIDIIEVDPPYGIDLVETKKEGNYITTQYEEVSVDDYVPFLAALMKECHRIMSENSWLIWWYAQEPWQEVVFQLLNASGFHLNRMFGAWVKPQGQSQQPDIYLANSLECFYYARKGHPVLQKQGRLNSFVFSTVFSGEKVHPTERPVDLMTELLQTFGLPGMRVLVPCCGSGNTMLAAYKLGMQAVGIDKSSKYKDSFIVRAMKL